MRASLCLVLGIVALFAVGGCRLARDLLPRTHTTSRSPDGRYVAFVHQGLNPDPPDDHLYLGPVGQPARAALWRALRVRCYFMVSPR
jgi:hypothetical protein